MERLPLSEKKKISEQELIKALQKGVENPETRRPFEDWIKQEEAKVTEPTDAIEFERKKGRLYAKAGYVAEGVETLEDALERAFQERNEELVKAIETEIDHVIGR